MERSPFRLALTLNFNAIKYSVHLPLQKSFTVKLFVVKNIYVGMKRVEKTEVSQDKACTVFFKNGVSVNVVL